MILQWLVPLGFLGLLGIGALIIIYIIRPKYVRRVLPSTYMWIRSMKFHRKRLPIDPFRDIIIFILQALAIAACATIIASPYLISEEVIYESNEQIVIIESSESMRAKLVGTGETRFKRAIDRAKAEVDDIVIRKGGTISIIIADKEPYYIIDGADKNNYADIISSLENAECSFGTANLSGALELAEDRVLKNPTAKITVYSGKTLGNLGDAVTCVPLADPDKEWNIAICECIPSFEENQYTFALDVAAYGKVSMDTTLHFEINGVDDGETSTNLPPLKIPISFNVDENGDELVQHIMLTVDPKDENIGGSADVVVDNFEEVVVQFRGLNDSLAEDDTMMVYGGKRDPINIEYYTTDRNIFFPSAITPMGERFKKTREVSIHTSIRESMLKITGCEYYFFEHTIPEEVIFEGLPQDGINVLLDPDEEGLELLDIGVTSIEPNHKLSEFTYLTASRSHPLLYDVNVKELGISMYTKLEFEEDSGFVPLLYCGEDPVLFYKNWRDFKMVIMAFSINQSNFATKPYDFLFFLSNLIDYYMPTTLTEYCYEIGDQVQFNCKGASLLVQNSRKENLGVFTEFPNAVTLDDLGTYTFTTRFGLKRDNEIRKVFVRTPVAESSLFTIEDLGFRIMNSEYEKEMEKDVFIWFAVAVLVLLFTEYLLQRGTIVGR